MSWTTPRTDWLPTDYVSFADYNRIANNIIYLVNTGKKLGYNITISDVVGDKKYNTIPVPKLWNAIEQAIENVNLDTFIFDIGETKTFLPNTSYIDYVELNRLESAILKIHRQMVVQRGNSYHYAFGFNCSSVYAVARVQEVDLEPEIEHNSD